ncbi:MAG: aminopeptidase [candidate division Zixibacteria bacterium]|nr:aminopeptidase [candidate division Zixibacteria bacterium]
MSLKKTDKIGIIGPGNSDISFSVKHMTQIKHVGRHNVPDGQVKTAPNKHSVNGRIQHNIRPSYYSTTFLDVRLDFKKCKVVEATGSDTRRINEILHLDDGARRAGEFAFGLNPHILKPVNDILLDEKITGSIHLAQGNSY